MDSSANSATAARVYPDLHDHVRALEEAGELRRIDIPINKDTELVPLVRWQFRGGVAEDDRKAWLFTNVTDSKGRKYDMPVLIGAVASNLRIYSIGLGVPPDKAIETWSRALANPMPPNVVESAPCQEIVFEGGDLDVPGQGIDALPAPIATPGWDNAPYLSATGFVTRDPDTGLQNLGTYRAQVKGPRRIGFNPSTQNRPGGYTHWLKYKARGEHMPAAFIIGGPMTVAYTGMWKVPESLDEFSVAGALAGHPLNVVRARTVDLLVPAEAEIVIEGYVDTEYLEPEGPFGESHGHVNMQEFNGVMHVTAITRRRDAIFQTYLSQLYPSEITAIRAMVHEHGFVQHLRDHLGIKGVNRVVTHRPLTGNRKVIFVVLERGVPATEVWRALYGVMSQQRAAGKIIIAVNDDIDPNNLDAVLWAIAFRCSPHLDMQIIKHKDPGHGPSEMVRAGSDSALLVDATLKQDLPPVSLPKREYMERARRIWEDTLGLPELSPESPWFGYSLGDWSEALEREAQRAVEGDFWETGRIGEQRRRNDVAMNTDIKDVDEQA
jgi:4-hydroxy-3-polyprenylbenzoate decarboxylase